MPPRRLDTPLPAHIAAARSQVPRWLCVAAVSVFVAYASQFLYFFVDDEGISYVYAQNILHGRGLIYTTLEGRVEGYSNFLHIWVSVAVLAVTHLFHLPKVDVFFIGKAMSFACGAGVLVLVWQMMKRAGTGLPGAMAGLAFLATAGPLAVWSCSSLEAVPFALLITLLLWAFVGREEPAYAVAACAASCAILERLDGFVYVGVVLGAFLVMGVQAHRRRFLRRVIAPVIVVFVVYHLGRLLYFGSLISTPLYAKVLYKLLPHDRLLLKNPDVPYWRRFVEVYGWVAAVAMTGLAALAAVRHRVALALVMSAAGFFLYLSIVGDWMFGFRFFVPMLPILALLVAMATGRIALARPKWGWALSLIVIAWTTSRAPGFLAAYEHDEQAQNFVAHPSRDLHRFFFPYYGLIDLLRDRITPGTVTANNQAGFVTFELDTENLDDLGICSRFEARLPTTDIYFTEVGRYSPTTAGPIMAAEAYLLHYDARFLIMRLDLLTHANNDRRPDTLLDGYYRLMAIDADDENAVYERTDKPADVYRRNPSSFLENLVHVSSVAAAAIDDVPVPVDQIPRALPYLRDAIGDVTFRDRRTLALSIGQMSAVSGIELDGVRSSGPVLVQFRLTGASGDTLFRRQMEIDWRALTPAAIALPAGLRASGLTIDFVSKTGGPATVTLDALRLLGQSPALGRYVRSELSFASPAAPASTASTVQAARLASAR